MAQFNWIVINPNLLGGKPAVRGTRISVALVLQCLAEGMTAAEIAADYPGFPAEAVPEVLHFASLQTDKPLSGDPDVAA
jgi:uncharacterized protein (DUF433 family)